MVEWSAWRGICQDGIERDVDYGLNDIEACMNGSIFYLFNNDLR